MKGAALAAALTALLPGLLSGPPAGADPLSEALGNDPLGTLVDVTDDWKRYQPAEAFCVEPSGIGFSSPDASATGADDACAFSGFEEADTGLLKVEIETPRLCNGCRRLFVDYYDEGGIPDNEPEAGRFYARGHTYFRLDSRNAYVADPLWHSPNIKNVSNDKFFAPEGSERERFARFFDLYAISFVGDVLLTHHSAVQGPYYIGPWYVNTDGERIRGAYVDVDVVSRATERPVGELNEIFYRAGFNSGEATCPDNVLFGGDFADGDYFYGGCVDRSGSSATGVNPYG